MLFTYIHGHVLCACTVTAGAISWLCVCYIPASRWCCACPGAAWQIKS